MIDIDLPNENGKNVKLSDVAGKGKKTVLIFSMMNQPESPALNIALSELFDNFGGNVAFYHVSFDADQYAWRDAARNLRWTTVIDPAGMTSDALRSYNVGSMPVFFIWTELIEGSRDSGVIFCIRSGSRIIKRLPVNYLCKHIITYYTALRILEIFVVDTLLELIPFCLIREIQRHEFLLERRKVGSLLRTAHCEIGTEIRGRRINSYAFYGINRKIDKFSLPVMVLAGCGEPKFKVSGEVEGGADRSLVLEKSDFYGRWIPVDSVRIKSSGKFEMESDALPDGREITIETGKLAKQADGAVEVRMGNTMLLATVCSAKEAGEGVDFMPLTVEYKEKYASIGRYPGGFLKREGRASDYEILTSRLVDRVLRPLFPFDVGTLHLGESGVDHPFAVDTRHANFGNGSVERNVAYCERRRGGNACQCIGSIVFISRVESDVYESLRMIVVGEERREEKQ